MNRTIPGMILAPLGKPESDESTVGQRGQVMLDKCANRSCATRFLYLNKGALFSIEFGSVVPQSGLHAEMGRHFQYFWLCERCCQTMILRVEGGQIIAVLREPEEPQYSVMEVHDDRTALIAALDCSRLAS